MGVVVGKMPALALGESESGIPLVVAVVFIGVAFVVFGFQGSLAFLICFSSSPYFN